MELSGSAITTTATTWTKQLSLGIHTWRVRANNEAGTSPWANPWTVEVTETVTPEPPLTPTLLSPTNNTITTAQTLTLAWQMGTDSPIPTSYNLNLGGHILTTTRTTSRTLFSIGVHTWTVRARNTAGVSPWATPWVLEIISEPSNNQIYLPLVLRHDRM